MGKAEAVTIIGGADGPTSVFIAGRSKQQSFAGRVRQRMYQYRYQRAEKRIRADPHSLKKVVLYAHKKYHAAEIPKKTKKYAEQYADAKAGLVILHKPQLTGGLKELTGRLEEIAQADVFDEKSAEELYSRIQQRIETAADVPDHEMPMDFHIYKIRTAGGQMEMQVDFRWDLFSISCSGSKKAVKKLEKISRELYLYYGVSKEDMKNRTKRYKALAAILSR